VFPVLSTVLFRRLRKQLSSSRRTGLHRHHEAALIWPLCSDLLRPYTRRFWYYEQVLLCRRLALVACICLIPSTSLFLPVSLFGIIQASTLIQHVASPYRHAWMNYAELVSLYLLLTNYLSALILQTVVLNSPNGFDSTANTWAIILFALNFIFLLMLVAALAQFVRGVAANALARFRAAAQRRGWAQQKKQQRQNGKHVTSESPSDDMDADDSISPEQYKTQLNHFGRETEVDDDRSSGMHLSVAPPSAAAADFRADPIFPHSSSSKDVAAGRDARSPSHSPPAASSVADGDGTPMRRLSLSRLSVNGNHTSRLRAAGAEEPLLHGTYDL
jgi:hypothetical protein